MEYFNLERAWAEKEDEDRLRAAQYPIQAVTKEASEVEGLDPDVLAIINVCKDAMTNPAYIDSGDYERMKQTSDEIRGLFFVF